MGTNNQPTRVEERQMRKLKRVMRVPMAQSVSLFKSRAGVQYSMYVSQDGSIMWLYSQCKRYSLYVDGTGKSELREYRV